MTMPFNYKTALGVPSVEYMINHEGLHIKLGSSWFPSSSRMDFNPRKNNTHPFPAAKDYSVLNTGTSTSPFLIHIYERIIWHDTIIQMPNRAENTMYISYVKDLDFFLKEEILIPEWNIPENSVSPEELTILILDALIKRRSPKALPSAKRVEYYTALRDSVLSRVDASAEGIELYDSIKSIEEAYILLSFFINGFTHGDFGNIMSMKKIIKQLDVFSNFFKAPVIPHIEPLLNSLYRTSSFEKDPSRMIFATYFPGYTWETSLKRAKISNEVAILSQSMGIPPKLKSIKEFAHSLPEEWMKELTANIIN